MESAPLAMEAMPRALHKGAGPNDEWQLVLTITFTHVKVLHPCAILA